MLKINIDKKCILYGNSKKIYEKSLFSSDLCSHILYLLPTVQPVSRYSHAHFHWKQTNFQLFGELTHQISSDFRSQCNFSIIFFQCFLKENILRKFERFIKLLYS